MKRMLKDLSPEDLEHYISSVQEKTFRVSQIAAWVYRNGASCYSQMSNIPAKLRDRMSTDLPLKCSLELHDKNTSVDGTVKYLFTLSDGNRIESVLIPDGKRLTLCISSQVGCALACTFCLTGRVGKIRNLRTSEIVDQYLYFNSKTHRPVSNIVFMGMGEPLDNLDNVVDAIKLLTDPRFAALSPRRITVSTSGLVPKIEMLGEVMPVNLSVSLNAPNDEIRNALMPVNRRYNIKQLLESVKKFPFPKGKMLTFEYVMLKDINDSDSNALELASLLKSVRCKINLIPFNEAYPLIYSSPDTLRVRAFQQILVSNGINARIRKNRGRDILGACGQLAASYPMRENIPAGMST